MRFLFGALLLLFVAASLALVALYNPGYVMIVREPFVLETSLAVFLLLLLALYAGFYVLARLATHIVKSPAALERWRQTRRTRKSRESFQAGLLHALGGEWLAAEQALLASLHGADQPLLVWLALAVVAQQQGNREKRDNYLGRAQQHAGGHALTARLLQSELQTRADQHEAALATLVDLHSTHPQHPQVARRLLHAYRAIGDWAGLSRLLQETEQHNRLTAAERRPFAIAAHRALLDLDLPAGARATLDRAWNAMPASLHEEPELVAAYARQLLRQQAADAGATLLADTLDRRWDDELVRLYGEAATSSPLTQLERALDWLPTHADNPALLIALARLARRAGQADRAQAWLEQARAHGGGRKAETELGQLCEARGEKDQALVHYRRALENN